MESTGSISKTLSLIVLVLFWNCLTQMGSNAQLIPEDEVQTLRIISAKLNNGYWNVSQTSCNNGAQSFNRNFTGKILSNVTCDCSFSRRTICHVTNIQLKGLNLSGELPIEFGNLTYLQEIDLSRNYINGSIPASLANLPLIILNLIDNRISGSIPYEVGQIATLEELILEDNLLEGHLPESLGNLSRLRRLLLSANNFTGSIPETFAKLKNLTDFLIDGNMLSGNIPDFIGNWTKLIRLNIQGTSLEGPIPSTLSLLTSLRELRISDLNESSTALPNLKEMTNLNLLVLRNCLITGAIPKYIGELANLTTLDLSFNRLTGTIPDTIENLQGLVYMFLTNNSLSGAVPSWIVNSKQNFDVSYNNFTDSSPASCQQSNVNLVSSFSSTKNNLISWCLTKDLPCPTKAKYHSLFINCGGRSTSYEGKDYSEDSSPLGPSNFASYGPYKWAYSSTGTYMYNDKANFIASNTFNLNVTGPDYYQTARLAPVSLKYYGLCLRSGSYRVQLHFAEIMYSDDQTFSSIGKRIFDVAIQGNLVLKDFNIMEKAGGVGKGITMDFKDIRVDSSTLEISLYWAGKGTTAVPDRGVYGPLISAITVTPNFSTSTGLSVGVIIGIVIASCVIMASILVLLWWRGYLGGKDYEDKEFQGLDTGYFTLRQIKAATDDFHPKNKIGEGGFGPVFKGLLPDGTVIAVKQLSSKSKQGNREFVNEIGIISALQHPNLVKLYGCCIEGKELLLVYEYMENNSLARALFGRDDQRLKLDWPTRQKMCLDIARGLAYLHGESRLKIVHRDIKATNVLLDKDLNAKISDFGLARLDEEENTHIITKIAGTIGYMAPEYAMRGYLTDKADVYSFGVVVFEIVSGKSNTTYRPKEEEEFVYLLDWAYVLHEQGNLLELMDPSLGSDYSEEEAWRDKRINKPIKNTCIDAAFTKSCWRLRTKSDDVSLSLRVKERSLFFLKLPESAFKRMIGGRPACNFHQKF
ncbi:hypothetical protein Nepgr_026109 [Nepenthes gracilis]|uniref:non-specific serine/threonine protein kinase n=1 Tax=Nepenthes gracilis TaxID=150966 RepID=A0AAD3T821_NEPGR|nr:hypothetical protein Nepgr_026109 [Nepenthes gracilis]